MYTRDMKGRFEGAFQCYLPREVTCAKMVEKFGERDTDNFCEPEKGYDGDEWTFFDAENRTLRVYMRYGMPRVGANSEEGVEAFAAWICSQLGIDAQPKLADLWISPIGTAVAIR